jgi:hypothetical protein
MPRTKQGSTKKEQELIKLLEFSCGGGLLYLGATVATLPEIALPAALSLALLAVTPLRSSRKHATISPSNETPPLKKATEQPMPEADFSDLNLEVEFKEEVLEEKDTETTKDTGTEYNFANTIIIDKNRTLVSDQHAVIHLDELICFLDSNFVCHNCGESKSLLQHQVVGIASSINWLCACKRVGDLTL